MFRSGDRSATGVVEGEFVRPLQGTFFENPIPTGEEIPLSQGVVTIGRLPDFFMSEAQSSTCFAWRFWTAGKSSRNS